MGFEADALICAGNNQANVDSGSSLHGFWMGLIKNGGGGSVTQVMQTQVERNNIAAGAPFSRMMDDKFGGQLLVTNGSLQSEYTASNFTSSGFDFTSSANASSMRFHFLAFNFGGLDCSVGQYDPPVTATTSTISSSFTPQFCMLGMNACQTVDVTEGDSDAGPFAISVMDSTAQHATGIAIEDAAATTNTESYTDNVAVLMHDHTGADMYTGTLSSFDSSGVNLSYSVADGTTRKWIYLMIETDVAAATGGLFFRPYSTIRAMLRR